MSRVVTKCKCGKVTSDCIVHDGGNATRTETSRFKCSRCRRKTNEIKGHGLTFGNGAKAHFFSSKRHTPYMKQWA